MIPRSVSDWLERRRVYKALQRLEAVGTVDQIAWWLYARGYRQPEHYTRQTTSCPVYQYLNAEVGCTGGISSSGVELKGSTVVVPPKVARFIDLFDNGTYPELKDSSLWRRNSIPEEDFNNSPID